MTNWGLWGYLTERANCNASVEVGVLDDPLFLPLTREVAFAVGKSRRERNGKISPPVKCYAFDSPLSEGAETAGASPRPTLIP